MRPDRHVCFAEEAKGVIAFIPYRLGGMCGAIVTSPFDVVKTRLQSDLFRQKHTAVNVIGDSAVLVARRPVGLLYHFVETAHIIRCVLIPLYSADPLSILIVDLTMTNTGTLLGTSHREHCLKASVQH